MAGLKDPETALGTGDVFAGENDAQRLADFFQPLWPGEVPDRLLARPGLDAR